MKKVFNSSSDVIHLFAQKTQNDARCNNVFFENPKDKEYGTKLYSYGYHYLLAEFLNENTIMINDTGYSVTTSKHISQVRSATSQYKQYFTTKTNINLVHEYILNNKARLTNARKPEMYINNIFSLWSSLNEYYEEMKIKKYKSNPKYKEIKKIVQALENSPVEYKEKLKELSIKKAKSDKLKAAKELKEKLIKFQNYEINSFRIQGINDCLRLSKDGQQVETSQYISVSVKAARYLYALIRQGKDIIGHKIDGYTVISINGTLKIGCHNIDRKEIERFARVMTW